MEASAILPCETPCNAGCACLTRAVGLVARTLLDAIGKIGSRLRKEVARCRAFPQSVPNLTPRYLLPARTFTRP